MHRRRLVVAGLFVVVVVFATASRLAFEEREAARPAPRVLRTPLDLYRYHFRDPRHERMFVASLSFFLVFGITRVVTHAIRAGRGPFHDVTTEGGGHIHHLVWGILLLLGIGYLWLLLLGTGTPGQLGWASPVTAALFGAGAALTLDEFALWFTFQDVYWQQQGRLSIDAVVLFGSLLSIGLWGAPFFRGLFRLLTGLS